MKAVNVPFHFPYGRLICSNRLQNDKPKCRGKLEDPGTPQNHALIIAICWKKSENFNLEDNPESALSNEV